MLALAGRGLAERVRAAKEPDGPLLRREGSLYTPTLRASGGSAIRAGDRGCRWTFLRLTKLMWIS
jgi:hypothetical protein